MSGVGRGRPRKPESEKLAETLNVKVTAPEYDEVYRRARLERMSMRAYARKLLRQALGFSGSFSRSS